MDDWRMMPQLTLNYGVRYEFFAPYTEKYGHLADVQSDPTGPFKAVAEAQAVEMGCRLRWCIHSAWRLRLGLGWRCDCRRRLWCERDSE